MVSSDASEGEGDPLRQIARVLHDMCQPLTAIQCRLEIDQMDREMTPLSSRSSSLAQDCLRECDRLNGLMATMRALLQRAFTAEREMHG